MPIPILFLCCRSRPNCHARSHVRQYEGYLHRIACTRNPEISRFDPVNVGELTFRELEAERYPCFELALRVAKRGGTWPAALCGADEVAVEMFLGEKIRFTDIAVVIEQALQAHDAIEDPTPSQSLAAASWAKDEVRKMLA